MHSSQYFATAPAGDVKITSLRTPLTVFLVVEHLDLFLLGAAEQRVVDDLQ